MVQQLREDPQRRFGLAAFDLQICNAAQRRLARPRIDIGKLLQCFNRLGRLSVRRTQVGQHLQRRQIVGIDRQCSLECLDRFEGPIVNRQQSRQTDEVGRSGVGTGRLLRRLFQQRRQFAGCAGQRDPLLPDLLLFHWRGCDVAGTIEFGQRRRIVLQSGQATGELQTLRQTQVQRCQISQHRQATLARPDGVVDFRQTQQRFGRATFADRHRLPHCVGIFLATLIVKQLAQSLAVLGIGRSQPDSSV